MLSRIWFFLTENMVARIIAAVLVAVGVILLLIMGASVAGFILLIFLVGVSMYFGSIRELAGSALVAVLLKVMGGTIKEVVSIWITASWVERFFTMINTTGYIPLILVVFFFFYLLSFTTGSIKLFRISTNVTNTQKQKYEQ